MICFIGNVKLDRLEYLGKIISFSEKLLFLIFLVIRPVFYQTFLIINRRNNFDEQLRCLS